MLDIESLDNGGRVRDTDLWKAENLLLTNVGSLYYLPAFGIDMGLFFSQDYNIQFESFMASVTDTMVQNGIDITKITNQIDAFLNSVIMTIGGNENAF